MQIGSGWDGLSFNFSSPFSAVLCIYSYRAVSPTHHPEGQQAVDGQEVWRGDSWDTRSELTQKIFHTVCIILSHEREGGKEKGGIFGVMVFGVMVSAF